jgi:hypothetical protein
MLSGFFLFVQSLPYAPLEPWHLAQQGNTSQLSGYLMSNHLYDFTLTIPIKLMFTIPLWQRYLRSSRRVLVPQPDT